MRSESEFTTDIDETLQLFHILMISFQKYVYILGFEFLNNSVFQVLGLRCVPTFLPTAQTRGLFLRCLLLGLSRDRGLLGCLCRLAFLSWRVY